MLVHEAQVEVIAEGVHVHQITDLVTLLCEEHGQLGSDRGGGAGVRVWEHTLSNPFFPPGQRGSLAALPVAVDPELPPPEQLLWGTFPLTLCCSSLVIWIQATRVANSSLTQIQQCSRG